MTTPREQLIEVIAEEAHKVRWGHKTGEHIGCNGIDMDDYSIASLSLHRLKEMGAVVVMPVMKRDTKDGKAEFWKPTVLESPGHAEIEISTTSGPIYVNALESEQS